jgi:peptidoglycan/xylan/chitin deacetylase (PgdA/CDA1 family)
MRSRCSSSGAMADHRVVLSVDLDDWYHARWATGSPSARWSDPAAARREAAWPADGLRKPTRSILELFDRHDVTATFFVLGEVAEREPELVREIAGRGHEIACHGLHHVDADLLGPERFSDELAAAKKTLDTLASQPVIGYRAPNLLVRDWMIRPLREQGFRYDASVCTARALLGKDYGHEHVAVNPYRFRQRFSQPDPEGDLVEIPVPVFPALRLPAATGIMTRVLGKAWTLAALRHALRTGDAQYYFHPYELGSRPAIAFGARERLFMRRVGPWMEDALDRILRKLRSWGVEPTTAASVASQTP